MSISDIPLRKKLALSLFSRYKAAEAKIHRLKFYLLSKDSDSAFKVVKELGEELFNKGNPEKMFYIINEFSEKDIRKNPYCSPKQFARKHSS